MAAFSVPVLPSQGFVNGQTSIPPPPAEDFDACFGGFLSERHIHMSALGQTAYYLYSSSACPPQSAAQDAKPRRRVVLMHGGSTPCINLIPLAKAIIGAPNNTPTDVLLFDMWGHGLSSSPVQAMSPSIFHIQILQLLHHLSWPLAHIVGFSISGSFAISFAAYNPSATASVTLIAPSGLLRRQSSSYRDRIIQSGGPGGLWAGWARSSIINFVDAGTPPNPPKDWRERIAKGEKLYDMDAVQVWQRENHRGHVAVLVGMFRDSGLFDLHDAYRAVAEGPVGKKALVILGVHDKLIRPDFMTKDLKQLGWVGQVEIMDDVGHLIVREKPTETAGMLLNFWDALSDD